MPHETHQPIGQSAWLRKRRVKYWSRDYVRLAPREACDVEPGATVKAISLWQPWASLMATGAKWIETRSWHTDYVGPLLICSARRRVEWELSDLLEVEDFQAGLRPLVGDSRPVVADDLVFGCGLALVDLYGCFGTRFLSSMDLGLQESFGDFEDGRWGWVTGGCRRLRPFPVQGRQGLFDVVLPGDLEDQTEDRR